MESCEACQKRGSGLPKELGKATGESTIFGRISLDAVHIKVGRWKYLIVAQDDLSGWVEAEPLVKLTSESAANFLKKEWIY